MYFWKPIYKTIQPTILLITVNISKYMRNIQQVANSNKNHNCREPVLYVAQIMSQWLMSTVIRYLFKQASHRRIGHVHPRGTKQQSKLPFLHSQLVFITILEQKNPYLPHKEICVFSERNTVILPQILLTLQPCFSKHFHIPFKTIYLDQIQLNEHYSVLEITRPRDLTNTGHFIFI